MADHLADALRGGGLAFVLGLSTFAACALDREGLSPGSAASTSTSGSGAGGEAATSSASGPGTGGATTSTATGGGQGGTGGTAGVGGQGGMPVCGDGTVTAPEECDDTNTTPYDGCSAECLDEKPDACPGTAIALDESGATITNDLTGKTNDAEGDCGGDAAGDLAYAVTVAQAGTLVATLSGSFDKVLYFRTDCDAELAGYCDRGQSNDATLRGAVEAGETVYVFADGYEGAEGPFTLTLDLIVCGDGNLEPPEECDDANLADGDGCSHDCIVTCPPGATKYDVTNHCYTWETQETSWQSARTACLAKGAGWDLASITSVGEQTFLDNNVNPSENAWLGGTDEVTEGVYVWTDGEAFSYAPWGPGEPNGGTSDNCIESVADTGFDYWATLSCSLSRDYICERKAAGEP
jgi:cysteine-rich repeat protein